MRVTITFTGSLAAALGRAGYKTAIDIPVKMSTLMRKYGKELREEIGDLDLNRTDAPSPTAKKARKDEKVEIDEKAPAVRKKLSPDMRKKLEDEQNIMFAKTRKEMTNRDRGPVLTSVVDPDTGEVFHGVNGSIPPNPRTPDDLPPDLHPVLEKRVDEYNKAIKDGEIVVGKYDNGQYANGEPGHHSEIWAIDQLFKAREARGIAVTDKSFDDVFLSNKIATKGKRAGAVGDSIIRCPDCSKITKGAHDVSEDITWRNE
jgi:hypothetical protein